MSDDRIFFPQKPPERRSSGRYLLIALALHVAILAYPVKRAIEKLDAAPQTVTVRLTDLVPPLTPVTPAPPKTQPRPLQPGPTIPHKLPPPRPRPVLAMAPEQTSAPSSFSVPSPANNPTTPSLTATAPASVAAASGPPGSLTPARFDAAYLHNPEPKYPAISRRLGEEGKTLLRVRVSRDGQPLTVDLEKSSNFERLDEAARQTVARWKFVPARRGDEPIEATVIVPIVFRLDS